MNIQVGKEREGDMICTLETGEHVFEFYCMPFTR